MSDVVNIPISETLAALRSFQGLKREDAIRVLVACLVMIRAERDAICVLQRLIEHSEHEPAREE